MLTFFFLLLLVVNSRDLTEVDGLCFHSSSKPFYKMILENEEAQKHIRHIFQDTKSIVQFYSSATVPHLFKVVLVYPARPTSVQ